MLALSGKICQRSSRSRRHNSTITPLILSVLRLHQLGVVVLPCGVGHVATALLHPGGRWFPHRCTPQGLHLAIYFIDVSIFSPIWSRKIFGGGHTTPLGRRLKIRPKSSAIRLFWTFRELLSPPRIMRLQRIRWSCRVSWRCRLTTLNSSCQILSSCYQIARRTAVLRQFVRARFALSDNERVSTTFSSTFRHHVSVHGIIRKFTTLLVDILLAAVFINSTNSARFGTCSRTCR